MSSLEEIFFYEFRAFGKQICQHPNLKPTDDATLFRGVGTTLYPRVCSAITVNVLFPVLPHAIHVLLQVSLGNENAGTIWASEKFPITIVFSHLFLTALTSEG